jgi:hypothetical protein
VCDTKDEWLIYREIFMNQQKRNSQPKPQPANQTLLNEVNLQKKKAEEIEVAGRHDNNGRKVHEGAH